MLAAGSVGRCGSGLPLQRRHRLLAAESAAEGSRLHRQRLPHPARPSKAHASAPPLQQPAPSTSCVAAQQADADMSTALTLDNIRQALIRQEDTIIFSLIERAQYALNEAVYEPDGIPVPGFGPGGQRLSLLEYMLREQEQLHAKVRRYTSPDEHAFYPEDLPPLVLPPITYPEVLMPGAKDININGRVMELYRRTLLPAITGPGDDNNYGSAAMYDVLALQALSKRIHYGKFVAEAKFRAGREAYAPLIAARDADGLMALLTDRAVEEKVVERVRLKAATFGQDLGVAGAADGAHYKVSPDMVAALYDKWVMPMTKDVQVQYLLRRLDAEPSSG